MKKIIIIKGKVLLNNVLIVLTVITMSETIFAMSNYNFGVVGSNNDNAVHFDTNIYYSDSNNGNRNVIHMDIGSVAQQQAVYKNSKRIGTLITPTGNTIGVFGGESMLSMDKGAGHFSYTGLNFSNTVLIGHNRGRTNGHFSFVKDLKLGEILTLEANGVTKKYVVSEMHKIHATDTELLNYQRDSRLSLVTCWEYEMDYRRVVVAYEVI